MNFYEAIDLCVNKNLSFAAWKSPADNEGTLIIQSSIDEIPFDLKSCFSSQKGFIFYPFSEKSEDPVFITADHIYRESDADIEIPDAISGNRATPPEECRFYEAGKQEFEQQVEEIVRRINAGGMSKAVLSRILIKDKPESFTTGEFFRRLSRKYSNAFNYVINAAGQLWCGATPEPLLLEKKDEYITTAVAGTRSATEQNLNLKTWNRKEREEQELVSRHIITCLNRHTSAPYSSFGPEPYPAGNVCHLKTVFSIPRAHLNGNLCEFVRDLHPTPAVCGLPKQSAFSFITQLEQHDRSYYSGFLGPVNVNTPLGLYVNLRCVRVLQDKVAIYVGAGITADSVAVREWEETAMKSETMLSVLSSLSAENA
jgi:isochorismate synthase